MMSVLSGSCPLFACAGEGFFRTEHGAVLSPEVVEFLRDKGGVGLSSIVTTGWACLSGGGMSSVRVGNMIPSSMPIGESGGVNSLDLSMGRTSGGTRSHGSSRLSVPASRVPRTAMVPSNWFFGWLMSARKLLTVIAFGDQEVLRVFRRVKRMTDAALASP